MLLQRAMAGAAHGDLVPAGPAALPQPRPRPADRGGHPRPDLLRRHLLRRRVPGLLVLLRHARPAGRRLPAGRQCRRGQPAPPGLDLLRRPALPVLARRQHRPRPSGAARGEGRAHPRARGGHRPRHALRQRRLRVRPPGRRLPGDAAERPPRDLRPRRPLSGRPGHGLPRRGPAARSPPHHLPRPDRRPVRRGRPGVGCRLPERGGRAGLGRDGDQLPARVLLLGRCRADGHGLPRRRHARSDRRRDRRTTSRSTAARSHAGSP